MFFKKQAKKKSLAGQHAECETVTAGPGSPIHFRVLTEQGQMPGGGADTNALCGRKVAWDLRTVTAEDVVEALPRQHESFRYCTGCVEQLTGIALEEQKKLVSHGRIAAQMY